MWQSPDPLLQTYLTGFPGGGVYIPSNLGAYSYAQQRPVVANDPSGEWINFVVGGIKGAIENVVIQNIEIAAGVRDEFSWGELAVDTAIGTVTSGTGNTVRNASRVANAIDAGRTGDRAQDASSAARIARNDAPADMAEQGVQRTETGSELLPGEGQVGTFRELSDAGSPGDNLTPHHMPSANRMSQEGVSRDNGIAMKMEQPFPGSGGRHRQTANYGTQADADMPLRDALAFNIRDARRIYQSEGRYTPEIRRGLQDTIQRNREMYPDLFLK